MKKTQGFVLIVCCLFSLTAMTQQISINEDGSPPNLNAILDIKSPTKGLLIPRLSTTSRLAIPNTKGLLVYDTTVNLFFYNTGLAWRNLATDTSLGGSSWSLTGNSGTSDSNFIGTIDDKPFNIRTNNTPAGCVDRSSRNAILGHNSNSGNGGSFNAVVGFESMVGNQTSTHNSALGAFALRATRFGAGNTGIGAFALETNTSGGLNTSVGFFSMTTNLLGSRNTAIGAFSDAGNTGLSNATAIGHGAVVSTSNKVRIGNASVTAIEGQVPFTTPSDGRFKFAVQEDVKGLEFILRLRPVSYQFNVQRFDASQRIRQKTENRPPDDELTKAAFTEAAGIRRIGFIAQEVEKAAQESGYNFSGIIKPVKEEDYYSLSYETFIMPLVKAVQELNAEVERLKKQLEQKSK